MYFLKLFVMTMWHFFQKQQINNNQQWGKKGGYFKKEQQKNSSPDKELLKKKKKPPKHSSYLNEVFKILFVFKNKTRMHVITSFPHDSGHPD